MKVGTVCLSTDQGLGYLALDFFKHGVVTDPVIISHGKRPDHQEWYPTGTPFFNHYSHPGVFANLVKCNSVLFFETPFDWTLIPRLRERGVRTVIMPMHECMPDPVPNHPDVYLCPSMLDEQWASLLPGFFMGHPRIKFLPVPVNVPWRQRTKCEVFVHNSGNGGLRGRNGTRELLAAMEFVESPITLILRSQCQLEVPVFQKFVPWKMLQRVGETVSFDQLWDEGDCFVFPEKFNGLSLPLQEARAAGMLVMAADRFPMNTWLPTKVRLTLKDEMMTDPGESIIDCDWPPEDMYWPTPLIPVEKELPTKVSMRCATFNEAIIRPRDIAAKIDEWYGRDITEYSLSGKAWAESMSWDTLKPLYMEALKCASST